MYINGTVTGTFGLTMEIPDADEISAKYLVDVFSTFPNTIIVDYSARETLHVSNDVLTLFEVNNQKQLQNLFSETGVNSNNYDMFISVNNELHKNEYVEEQYKVSTGRGRTKFVKVTGMIAEITQNKKILLVFMEDVTLSIKQEASLQETVTEAHDAYRALIMGLSAALDWREKETDGHSERVSEIAVWMGREWGMTETQLQNMWVGAMLHDFGKLSVPESVLASPLQLNQEELKRVRNHPNFAQQWLSKQKHLSAAIDIPLYHHEHYEGGGYPEGLMGEEIPISARIFTIAHTWDTMLHNRPFRPAFPMAMATNFIIDQAGKRFDPNLIKVFRNYLFAKNPAAFVKLRSKFSPKVLRGTN